MSPQSDPSPLPESESTRPRSRFWVRWGVAAAVLAMLAVYGAFLEGGPSPLQEANEPGGTAADEHVEDGPEALAPDAAPEDHATAGANGAPRRAFETQVHAGSGPDRIELEVPDGQPAIMIITHGGSAGFVVEVRDEAGTTDLVVDAVGAYEGTHPVNLGETVDTYDQLDIDADGDWMISVLPLSAATRVEDGAVAGRGDDVVRIDGGGRARFRHDGPGAITVVEYRGPELFAGLAVVDEVGTYDGLIRITEDAEVLVITADGAWELSID